MKIGELQSVSGQCIQIGGVDVRSVTTELSEAGVVHQYQDHIGCAVIWVWANGEVWFGFVESSTYPTLERRTRYGRHIFPLDRNGGQIFTDDNFSVEVFAG